MQNSLLTMTNEQLWAIFPIILSQHDPKWREAYETERALLQENVCADNIARISHIGSTAVAGLIAKPTIDILLEIRDNTDITALTNAIESAGYLLSPQPNNPPPHRMFLKGYTPEGFVGQAYHVHVRYYGDWDELYFRDYLIAHPDAAQAYGALKQRLQQQYAHDRDGYTLAKTDFITKHTALARRERTICTI